MVANNILVDFDMIINTDLGILKYMKKEGLTNRDIILPLIKSDDAILNQLLYDREKENPLSIIITPECLKKENDYDDHLYYTIINASYKDVLKYSITTDMANLIKVYLNTELIEITILCKNILEQQFINDIQPSYKTIVESDLSKINLEDFDTIYMKYFKSFLEFEEFEGKNIYIANYKFNLEKDSIFPKKEIRNKLNEALKIFAIDLYNRDKFINIKG